VGTKAERRAARERVATYHEARLAELIEHITELPASCGSSAGPAVAEHTSSSSRTSSIKWPPTAKSSTGGIKSRRDKRE
jgi:hypothetical protein